MKRRGLCSAEAVAPAAAVPRAPVFRAWGLLRAALMGAGVMRGAVTRAALMGAALMGAALAAANTGSLAAQQATDPMAEALGAAESAFRSGAYTSAARDFRRLLRRDPESVAARRGLVRALTVTGAYEEAEEVAREAPNPVMLANTLGEVLLATGRLGAADSAFTRAVRGGADDALTARVNRGELLLRRGRRAEASAVFDALIDVYNRTDGRLSARDLVAVGRAVRHLGRTNPDLFQDALRAFDEAAGADPGWAEPAVRAGDLFLEKYSSPEAQAEYQRVLEANPNHPGALLGMARALDFDGTGGSWGLLERILDLNPRHVGARVLAARLHLSREEHAEAVEEARAALDVDPSSLDALSVLAAAHFVAGDTAAFRRTRERVLALSPGYAGLDVVVGEVAVDVRRYAEAARRGRAAAELDPTSWEGWGLLGMNETRLGDVDQGRAHLERAFAGDPYNPWYKNSLDLLDTFVRYTTVPTEHFRLVLHQTEAELLGPLMSELAEEAFDSLARRYGVEPPLPIRVEVFPSHDDFSVRTLGETGLGALGVAFGSTLVMDAPSARRPGEYNWASVFWHELAHAFHLGMTHNRVPRWFSEGLAVHEQRKARAGWGHQASIDFLQALRDRRLEPVSTLNDGFMRPDYPQQVVHSYYQASLVFELIEERHGFEAIRRMLQGYEAGATTAELFADILGGSPEAFDDEFDAWLRERFAGALKGLAPLGDAPPASAGPDALADYVRAHPGDLVARIRLGAALTQAERFDEAVPHLEAALEMFPDYGGSDSPWWYLARVHAARGDTAAALAALDRLGQLSESNLAAMRFEADLRAASGDVRGAANALARTVDVYPYDLDVLTRLAELRTGAGDAAGAVRARRAVVALGPPDRADALYRLAVAYRDAGELDAARRTVLRALEVAPNFDAALELLLELRGIGAGGAA